MERLRRSWQLMRESFGVLRSNPRLAIFPVVSGIISIAVAVSFAIPTFLSEHTKTWHGMQPVHYVVLFAYYFSSYFVVTFFNAALIVAARRTMDGERPSLSDGLTAAGRHLGSIAAWSLLSASVGTVLRVISDQSEIVGKIVASIFGAAWNIVTYFTVPMLVLEGVSPREAIIGSFDTIKRTWGESLVGNAGIGFGSLVFALVPVPLLVLSFVTQRAMFILPALGIALIYWICLAAVAAAMDGIYRTAVFVYARKGQIPEGFSPIYIQTAFLPKEPKMDDTLRLTR